MGQATRSIFLRKRRIPRRTFATLGVVLALLTIFTGLLWFMGRAAPPPTFKIGDAGLLTPTEYPLWQQASDWIAGRRYVVLTFDDGPYGHGIDEQILATLKKNHAHAIFFEVCAHIDHETAKVPKSIVASGDILGNHSFSHLHLPPLGRNALNQQITGCSDNLEAISGHRPKFFRPPWGQTSPVVLETAHSAGMQQVLWNANSGDTWLADPQQIISMTLEEVALNRASIVLMHSRPATASALDTLLYDLKRRGVRFVLPVYE